MRAVDHPDAYIAGDRRRALAAGLPMPDRVRGCALFADISGFTPLTEALVAQLGVQRGAEELSRILDELFQVHLGVLHRHGGSVVYFSGDSVTCWLDGDDGRLAVSCALAMQEVIADAGVVTLPSGDQVTLSMKIALSSGPARRFVVGDPDIQLIDVLAGRLMDTLAATERHSRSGEVVLDAATARALHGVVDGSWKPERITLGDNASDADPPYVVTGLVTPMTPPGPPAEVDPLPEEIVRQWLLPPVYERMRTGGGEFLAELRTAVPLFLRFGGIDYDEDPHALTALDTFVRDAQHVIDAYGGSTLQLTLGDKGAYLYAVFGAPHAHEDDAARACTAALELLTLGDTGKVTAVTDLQIGLGLGRVRSGTYGHTNRRTFCCLGDPVNLAARLMSAAPPGRIYASAAVRAAAGEGFRWERLEDQRLKGKAAAVQAFRLTAVDRGRAAARHRRHVLALVGRDEPLARLVALADLAVAGAGQVAVVTGPAGVGKSRLVVEVVRALAGRGVTLAEGEAQAFGARASYAAWQEVWTELLGLEATVASPLSPTERLDAVTERVAALDATLTLRSVLLAMVLGVDLPDNDLTASLTPVLRKGSLEALLVSLLERLVARDGPLVLVLEDAQWLDPLSVDLLLAVTQAVSRLPVLVLIAHRTETSSAEPEASATAEVEVTGGGSATPLATLRAGLPAPGLTEVALGELDRTDAAVLVGQVLAHLGYDDLASPDAVPPALLDLVLDRCDGNPFYLEELVTVVHERGVDPADAAAMAALDLPDSLHRLVLSRIDTLDEGPRRSIKVASVIGRVVETPTLEGVYPELGTSAEMAGHLGALRSGGLLVRSAVASALAPESPETHTFRQVITAQAAYEATPAALRESLHERVGDFLETQGAATTGAQLDLLAYHYVHSTNRAKQREYLVRAGDRARTDYANSVAIEHYSRVTGLLEETERGAVLLRLGGVLELTGAWTDAEARYLEALRLAEGTSDATGQNRARKALGEVARKQGRYDDADTLLAEARAGFEGQQDRAGVGEVLHLAGTLAAQQGDYDLARSRYEASLEIRRSLDDADGMAAIYSNLGVIAEYTDDLPLARELNEQALALRLEVGNRWAIGVSQNNLGMNALLRHDPQEAESRFLEALRLHTEVGDVWMVAIAHHNLGNAQRDLGRLDDAAGHLAVALSAYRRQSDPWALSIVYEDIAALCVKRGDAVRALTLAGASDRVRETIGSPRSPAQEIAFDGVLAPAVSALAGSGDDPARWRSHGRGLDGEAVAREAAHACDAPSG